MAFWDVASTGSTSVFRDALDAPSSGFDDDGELRFLRYEKAGSPDPVHSFEWIYDDSKNRESMLDASPTKAVKWEYHSPSTCPHIGEGGSSIFD